MLSYVPELYWVSQKQELTKETALLRISAKMNPMPGQYLIVSGFGTGEEAYPVCSFDESQVDIVVRDTGNLASKLYSLSRNSPIYLRGPYGHGFPLKEIEGRHVIVIADAIGAGAARSCIQYLQLNKQKYKDIQVFLGFGNADDVLFKDEIEGWTKDFAVTIDKGQHKVFPSEGFGDWLIIAESSVALISGSLDMIRISADRLKGKGFQDSQIYFYPDRKISCGVGKCGRCMVNGKYVCKDGPVLNGQRLADG
jgi:NAD(P)H-flavin reductase